MTHQPHTTRKHVRQRKSGFTLTELLVVMGVIALLAGLTAVSYRAVAKDAKLASAKNTVMAVLDNARAMAMKNNRPTMVMFIPRFVNEKDVRIEAVIAEWSGSVNKYEVLIPPTPPCSNGSEGWRIFERFTAVKGLAPRQLAEGINVAGPNLNTCLNDDEKWVFPSKPLRPHETPDAQTEAPGRAVAVLYLQDGSTASHVPVTATGMNNYPYIDFDLDGLITSEFDHTSVHHIDTYYWMVRANDEPCAQIVPYLTVFDEEQARDLMGDDDWNDAVIRENEVSQYINANADRIHFNRYTGVAMK